MVDWMLFIFLFEQLSAILETMISQAVTNRCLNLGHQRNSMQPVFDQPRNHKSGEKRYYIKQAPSYLADKFYQQCSDVVVR